MTENRIKLLCGIIGHRPLQGRCPPPSRKEVKVEVEEEVEEEEEEDEDEDEMVLTK